MRNWSACLCLFLAWFLGFEFFWRVRIANFVRVEINDTEGCSMFYFADSQIVQQRPPPTVLFEIVRDAFGQQNVAGIATIHHALGHVNARASNVCLFV